MLGPVKAAVWFAVLGLAWILGFSEPITFKYSVINDEIEADQAARPKALKATQFKSRSA